MTNPTMRSPHESRDDCTDCTLHDRRGFLVKTLAGIAAAALVLPGIVHAESMAGFVLHHAARDADGLVRYPLPTIDGATIDAENEVIVVRLAGACMAFALSCPHQRAVLRVKRGDSAFLCPKHKSEYRLDGAYIRGRATRNMDRRAIRREGAELVVDTESLIKSDASPAEWAAATVPA
jgi:nitrite reductase/ring-hydroxylating ferredoxin subunit